MLPDINWTLRYENREKLEAVFPLFAVQPGLPMHFTSHTSSFYIVIIPCELSLPGKLFESDACISLACRSTAVFETASTSIESVEIRRVRNKYF